MRFVFLVFLFVSKVFILSAEDNYFRYFTEARLRFDYYFHGNSSSSTIYPHRLIKEPQWGGACLNLLDTFLYEELKFEVYDSLYGVLIYSRSYSSLFKEWQTTNAAKEGGQIFPGSIVMPFPRNTIKISILERDNNLEFQIKYEVYVSPSDIFLNTEKPDSVMILNDYVHGESEKLLDIALVSEGYTQEQYAKYQKDFQTFVRKLFEWEPYCLNKNKINVWGVFIASEESGSDIPHDSIWRNTNLNTAYNTFGSERYLTVPDITLLRDAVGAIPYDQLVVLVNSEKYGGGGIYNSYSIFSAHDTNAEFLFHHEFGHSFAGLADEYYTSSVAYDDLHDIDYEPYQPNVTTLINFKTKWADLIPDTVPVPTPDSSLFDSVVGVYEGAMYSPKGIYRPMRNCSMKARSVNLFCPVCRRAIQQMIDFYAE